MIRLRRPEAPAFLAEHGNAWSERWAARRAEDPAARFRWVSYEGTAVNLHVRPLLAAMTAGHCAYCDASELGAVSLETIDHFRPKDAFPLHAYAWANLFPACDVCQNTKGNQFVDELLKPDDDEYTFERFFLYDVKTGELEPNPGARAEDQRRAAETIRIFGLNLHGRPTSRKRMRERRLRQGDDPEPLDTWPYRFAVMT